MHHFLITIVAGKWDSVVIRIEDKTKKASVEQTIPLHFERFPDMHPFQDDQFAIALVGYNKK